MINKIMKTTETVSPFHVDKVSDRISDLVLDEVLKKDKDARVAIETTLKDGAITLSGEITSKYNVNYKEIEKTIREKIGYNVALNNHKFVYNITKQSPELNSLNNNKITNGDQGFTIGYAANNKSTNYLDVDYYIAQLINIMVGNHYNEWYYGKPRSTTFPDYKIQVGYDENKEEVKYINISYAKMNDEIISHNKVLASTDKLWEDILEIIENKDNIRFSKDYKRIVNTGGEWSTSFDVADTGLTGRKLVNDTYGGVRIGGGALSGKDYTKVDRTGAYIARWLAKNYIARVEGVGQVEIELGFLIGQETPSGIRIIKDNKPSYDKRDYEILREIIKDAKINKSGDIILKDFVEYFDMKNISYEPLARYGHFTNRSLPWELIV